MKLNAMNGVLLVFESHDFLLGSPGGDFEAIGECIALDDERVVAGSFERIWQAGEDAGAIVVNGRGLAMHEAVCADYIAAVDLTDRLVAETDSQDGVVAPSWRMRSSEMPASFGEHGPGEMQIFSGARAFTSSTVRASLRWICISTPSSPKYWTRL